MNILAIDTSGPVCGAAVLSGCRLRSALLSQNKMTHSVNLLPMVDTALASAGLTLEEMDHLAVVVGPGSFTGVRIGVSTVKGLAHGAGKSCIPINAMEALAAGAGLFPGTICTILDARAGQVYGAAFRAGDPLPERLLPDAPMMLEDYVSAIRPLGDSFLFVGDGVDVHRDRLSELLGEKARFAPAHLSLLRPGTVACLAETRAAEAVTWAELMPLYLRAPSAERNKKLMEAASHDE